MIRPEVKALFWRWREVLFACGLVVLGLWWAVNAFGIVQWIGGALATLGAGLAIVAAQKVRFRGLGDGPGVVTMVERRITYLGPEDGGVADLDLMVQLDLTPGGAWRLINGDGHHLDIPTNAMGAEALFDLFAALPGMKTEYMLSVLSRTRPAQMTVWMAPGHQPYTRLH